MSLTDPELDLLREMLADDPAAEMYSEVARALIARELWGEAADILSRALKVHSGDLAGWALYAEAAVHADRYQEAQAALDTLGADSSEDAHITRIRVLALEGTGNIDQARAAAEQYLSAHGDDAQIRTLLSRLEAPPPDPASRARDPFLTVAQAERYVEMGRIDKAVRAYRRIAYNNPGDQAIQARLRQLETRPHAAAASSSSTDNAPPPELSMPAPALGWVDEDAETERFQRPFPHIRRLPGTDDVRSALNEAPPVQGDVNAVAPEGQVGEIRRDDK